ncbi:hypothetical protein PDJ90_26765 [Bacillus cereus]|nr:hypothetical protein [Bacillus cereus]
MAELAEIIYADVEKGEVNLIIKVELSIIFNEIALLNIINA